MFSFRILQENLYIEHKSLSMKTPAYLKCEIKQEFSEKADDIICDMNLKDIQLLLE